jgi:hypothetical protein
MNLSSSKRFAEDDLEDVPVRSLLKGDSAPIPLWLSVLFVAVAIVLELALLLVRQKV